MKNRNFVWLWIGAIFFGFGLLRVFPAQASDGREVSGFYDVIEAKSPNADEVQVTLRIRLMNQTETSLTITQVELQSFPPNPNPKTTRAAATAPTLFLTAHEHQTIEQQFTVSRAEYEQWQKGRRLRFLVRFETAASESIARIVQLMRLERMGE